MSRVLVLHMRMIAASSFQPVAAAVFQSLDLHGGTFFSCCNEPVYLPAPNPEQELALTRP